MPAAGSMVRSNNLIFRNVPLKAGLQWQVVYSKNDVSITVMPAGDRPHTLEMRLLAGSSYTTISNHQRQFHDPRCGRLVLRRGQSRSSYLTNVDEIASVAFYQSTSSVVNSLSGAAEIPGTVTTDGDGNWSLDVTGDSSFLSVSAIAEDVLRTGYRSVRPGERSHCDHLQFQR